MFRAYVMEQVLMLGATVALACMLVIVITLVVMYRRQEDKLREERITSNSLRLRVMYLEEHVEHLERFRPR